MPEDKIYISDLLDKYPRLYDYDYKWRDSENYHDLDELLLDLGYTLACGEVKAGEYNDIKGYLNCRVKKLK